MTSEVPRHLNDDSGNSVIPRTFWAFQEPFWPGPGPMGPTVPARDPWGGVGWWIKDPKNFRHNTRMPAIFEQANQQSPKVTAYNHVEIAGMTEYLFSDKNGKTRGSNSDRFLGDPVNGEKLFNAVGCMGCHISEKDPENTPQINNYKILTKVQGPNLIGLGSKVSSQWLYEWLMDPQAYMPDTKMPDLRLEPQQAKDIAAYLIQDKNESKLLDWLRQEDHVHGRKMNAENLVEKVTGSDDIRRVVGKWRVHHHGWCYWY